MATSYELFFMPTCPFCKKVLSFMAEHGIDLKLRDISSDQEARSELENIGGKVQVPCLFIDGKPMYESDDIIAYLRTAFGVESKGDTGAESNVCPIF